LNHSLAWASDSKQLFFSSHDGYIYHVDVLTGTTLSKWQIESNDAPPCIALASNETFIAVSTGSSVSFWDTTSQEQIGTVIEYTHNVTPIAVSSNFDLVTSGEKRIAVRALCGILPSHYLDNVSVLHNNNKLVIADHSIRCCRLPAYRKSGTHRSRK